MKFDGAFGHIDGESATGDEIEAEDAVKISSVRKGIGGDLEILSAFSQCFDRAEDDEFRALFAASRHELQRLASRSVATRDSEPSRVDHRRGGARVEGQFQIGETPEGPFYGDGNLEEAEIESEVRGHRKNANSPSHGAPV